MKSPDALERVIRPIVEGQIRGFIKEHPSILRGVDWYKIDGRDPSDTLVGSLSKRIVRDLTCATSRARLAAALLEPPLGEPPIGAAGRLLGASPAGLEVRTGPAGSAR